MGLHNNPISAFGKFIEVTDYERTHGDMMHEGNPHLRLSFLDTSLNPTVYNFYWRRRSQFCSNGRNTCKPVYACSKLRRQFC